MSEKLKTVNIDTNEENWQALKVYAVLKDKQLIEVHDEAIANYLKKNRVKMPPKN